MIASRRPGRATWATNDVSDVEAFYGKFMSETTQSDSFG